MSQSSYTIVYDGHNIKYKKLHSSKLFEQEIYVLIVGMSVQYIKAIFSIH